jgi:uncharacterized protein
MDTDREDIPAQIHLEPIAAPSILGLYGLAAATFVMAAHQAGWFGSDQSALFIAPFAALLGGLAQFVAAMWGYKARDGLATAMHGVWGCAWFAYAGTAMLAATGRLVIPQGSLPEAGFCFFALAAMTWVGMGAATAENRALAWAWGAMALGSTVAAIAALSGVGAWTVLSAYIFIIASIIAWYTASALMLEGAFGRVVWPLGLPKPAAERRVAIGMGEPGVIRGQA